MHYEHAHAFQKANKLSERLNITVDAQNICLLLLKKVSYYSCSSNGTPLTNLLTAKGHFKSLSWINATPIPIFEC
jgi:hypothetical protein